MRDKRLATAVATLLVAFSTAHLMQFGLSAGQVLSKGSAAEPIGLATLFARAGGAGPAAQPDASGSPPPPPALAGPPPLPTARALAQEGRLRPALDDPRGDDTDPSCKRHLTARPGPGATVRTDLVAPCDPGDRVVFTHAGLRFALLTGADGRAAADIPAMRPEAFVTVRFDDGAVLTARAEVSEAARLDRVALVSEGWSGLSLHPAEAGAGHSAESRRADGILQLGDPTIDAPLLSEVHTLPAGRFGSLATVRLALEAVVTPANCGRDVAAALVTSRSPEAPTRLALAIPACEAAGEIMVLPLPPTDLRLARQ